ncbi:MAG: hypothetical protein HY696_01895 [Deltaproteobacteria bacterium]|nr:hypothetical protein [Deltaproteobacteria bacterium]
MPPPTITAELLAFHQLTPHVREFRFRPLQPTRVPFNAGQYINIVVDPGDDSRPAITRAYSLCTPPHETGYLGVVANLVPGGAGSSFLFNLHPGQVLTLRGPLGSFTLDERGTRDYLFVATGTGIGPIRSMLRSLLARGTDRQVTLYWGLRHDADVYYQDEWQQLVAAHANFHFVTTLSQPSATWSGVVGRVTQLVAQRITTVKDLDVYLCGRGEMIQDVRAYLKTLGLCPVHMEKFF